MRQTVYVCGHYMDADIYPVFQPAGKRRKKCRPTSKIQEKLNQKNAEKRITRLVHLNFTGKDVALHLTYTTPPESPEQAKRDLYNYICRIKRARKKLGLSPLKYISCTETGKKTGRVHHHLILSGGMDRDVLEELWGKGFANSKRLQFGPDGVTGLAHYIVKDREFYKRWNSSKNLEQPVPRIIDRGITLEQVQEMEEIIGQRQEHGYFETLYRDYLLTEATFTRNGVNRGAYIHIEMRRTSAGRPPADGLPCAIPNKW